jgi:hypothetical protein
MSAATAPDHGHPLARDLHWAIASPPLLRSESDQFCEWPDADFFARLWASHAQPPLHERDGHALPPMRLGRYFEWLWHLWLRAHPRYQLLQANAVWREHGITVGETDLLIRDRETAQIEHWELAVKFYLGHGDLSQRAHWHGPQFRDRLDRKYHHLKLTQTRLTLQPAVQRQLRQQGLVVARARCIVKGRLFLPWLAYWQHAAIAFAAPHFLRGFWLTVSDWQQYGGTYRYLRRLSREQFLAPLPCGALSEDDVVRSVRNGQRPLAVALCQADGRELHRGFIVPDDWPQQALHQQQQALYEDAPQIEQAECHNQ